MTWLFAIGGFLKKLPWQAYAAIGLLISAWIWGNQRFEQGEQRERARWEAAAAKAKVRADKATVTAGEQRSADTIRNTEAERARTDAIAANPDDPYRALACQRLRAAGQHTAATEAGCAGGD